ncbi:Beta-xylosidase/alpha-L-arabinofuranosidase 1 [Sesamum angolense]|uniref:Beta-xylosidase/alpha-L-arabinofuranosidase 1 n=1 Tax=Sesamum angolense TaxID=2727404 RepID=A0AAE1WU52_9LAMI|nr:Beta-xylosidase/alpha-L-arabinofuranosidase 1 [Sesamum angolense]
MGKVKEAEIDSVLKNLYTVLMRLGFFDGSPKFENLGKPDVCSNEHIELATEAARQGIVLLKNEAETLPLSSEKIKTIAVIGPHANATSAMIGNYAGVPCKYTSPIDGLSKFGEVIYEMGCDGVLCKNESLIFPAMRAASKADATILVFGLDLSVEAESLDRVDLLIPGYQSQLISQVAEVSKGPVVVVVMSAGGVDISFAKNDPNIHSIIWAGYPGEEGGRAIADVVFGRYNPGILCSSSILLLLQMRFDVICILDIIPLFLFDIGGKLPLTWHENDYVNMLPMTSMRLRPVDSLGYPGRTYKFFNGSTVYPFGYGLSYTNFTYKPVSTKNKLNIRLNKFQHCKDLEYSDGSYKPACPAVLIDDLKCESHKVELAIEVANTGKRDGSDVVMVYWSATSGIAEAPIKQLVAFKRVLVKAGRSEKLKFELNGCKSFGIVNNSGYKLLPSGGGKIEIGDGLLTVPVQINFHRGAL